MVHLLSPCFCLLRLWGWSAVAKGVPHLPEVFDAGRSWISTRYSGGCSWATTQTHWRRSCHCFAAQQSSFGCDRIGWADLDIHRLSIKTYECNNQSSLSILHTVYLYINVWYHMFCFLARCASYTILWGLNWLSLTHALHKSSDQVV